MQLDDKTMRLIAVGASITANCQSCLHTTVTAALAEGIAAQEIAEAIEIGKMVRRGAASQIDKFAAGLNQESSVSSPPDLRCGCA